MQFWTYPHKVENSIFTLSKGGPGGKRSFPLACQGLCLESVAVLNPLHALRIFVILGLHKGPGYDIFRHALAWKL